MTTTTRQSITFGHVYTDAKGRRFRADRFTPASETIVYGYLWDEKREAWGSRLVHRPVEDLTPTAAPEAQAPAGREPRTWDATTAETHTCAGACGQTLPAKSFPTTGKDGRRGVVCRKDRDAARSAA